MRRYSTCGAVAAALVLLAGCGLAERSPRVPQTPEQLKARYGAARGMTNVTQQAEALAVVARDAAEAGVADQAVQAVKAIVPVPNRDAAAEECALILARRGDPKPATDLAKMILNGSQRDSVLAKIAAGDR